MSLRRRLMMAQNLDDCDICYTIVVPEGGGAFNPNLFQQNGFTAITNWGDGTEPTVGVASHTYTSGGTFKVRYWRNGGEFYHQSTVYGTGGSYIVSLDRWKNPELITSTWWYGRFFFGCSNLRSLPKDFTFVNAVYCKGAFMFCSSLTSLPSGFRCGGEDCSSMFAFCSSLTSLPDGFSFPNATNCGVLTNYVGCFGKCSSLASLPDSFAIPKATITNAMFTGCSSLVYTPKASEYWDNPNITQHDGCFAGCTSMPNYTNIPEDWK